MRSLRSGWFLVLFVAFFVATAKSADNASDPTDYPATIHALAMKLADPKEINREAAAIKLSMLPPEGFSALDAATTFPDLPEEARANLKKIVERERPWQPALLRRLAESKKETDWLKANALAAYQKSHHRSPKWDEPAIAAINLCFSNKDAWPKTRALLEKAIEAGCDDPGILLLEVRYLDYVGADPQQVIKLHKQIHDAFVDEPINAYEREWEILNYITALQGRARGIARTRHNNAYDDATLSTLRNLQEESLTLFPRVAKQRPPSYTLCNLAISILSNQDDFHRPMDQVYARIQPTLDAVLPNDAGPLVVKGTAFVRWAWQAIQVDAAGNITNKNEKLINQRVDEAEAILKKAYEMDPNDPRAAEEMIFAIIERGQPREEMEKWFKRAMDADPNYFGALTAKMYYLDPQWYGSEEDELAFAHECFASQNWQGSAPFMVSSIHMQLANESFSKDQYYAQPAVWRDIQHLYEPYLVANPDAVAARSDYCYFACHSKHWDIARQQFQVMGAEVPIRKFGSLENMRDFRKRAMSNKVDNAP